MSEKIITTAVSAVQGTCPLCVAEQNDLHISLTGTETVIWRDLNSNCLNIKEGTTHK
jgi:hypothetical protein